MSITVIFFTLSCMLCPDSLLYTSYMVQLSMTLELRSDLGDIVQKISHSHFLVMQIMQCLLIFGYFTSNCLYGYDWSVLNDNLCTQ